MKNVQIGLPWLVRMKPGALQRLGLYLARPCLTSVALFHSEGLPPSILDVALRSLRDHGIALALLHAVTDASVEEAGRLLGVPKEQVKTKWGKPSSGPPLPPLTGRLPPKPPATAPSGKSP